MTLVIAEVDPKVVVVPALHIYPRDYRAERADAGFDDLMASDFYLGLILIAGVSDRDEIGSAVHQRQSANAIECGNQIVCARENPRACRRGQRRDAGGPDVISR